MTARRWNLAVLIWIAMSAVAGVARAEPVSVRAAGHDDFGRIVFGWQAPVGYELVTSGNSTTVRFSRPIEASYQRVIGALGKYIGEMTTGDDGRSVRLTLKGDFEVYGYDSGNAVIVEIADKDGADDETGISNVSAEDEGGAADKAEATSTSPSETGSVAENLPSVRVRAGEHDEYTRLVFDWPSKVPYNLTQNGGIVTVDFGQSAIIDVAQLQSSRPPFIGGIRSNSDGKGVQVTLTVPESSKVRHFLSGSKVVVDVPRPSDGTVAEALPKAVVETPASASTQDTTTSEAESEVAKAKIAAASAKDNSESEKPAQSADTEPSSIPEPASSTPTPSAIAPAPVIPTPTATAITGAGGSPTPVDAPTALTPAPEQSVQQAQVSAATSEGVEGISLRFDWDEPVGAAVFRRAGSLWIAFGKPSEVDVAELTRSGGNLIHQIQQMPTPNATVLRVHTVTGINPTIQRDGLSWLLQFQQQELAAQTAINVDAQPDSPVGSRIFLPVTEPSLPIGVTDPAVGDNLIIVPVFPLGHGMVKEYVYPEVQLLRTAQGMVIKPRIDDIRARSIRQGVEVTAAEQLQISPVTPEDLAKSKVADDGPMNRILDLEKWGIPKPTAYLPKKRELQEAVSRSKGDQREKARLDLARFYLANSFGAEALGIFQRMVFDRPDIGDDPEFRLLHGISNFLMARYTDAGESFAHASLEGSDEGDFWRAANQAKTGKGSAAAGQLLRTGSIPTVYPKPLRVSLGILVAEAAIEIGDVAQAKVFLDALIADAPNPAQMSMINFVEGKRLELGGDADGAVAKWEEVGQGRDRSSRTKAAWARMELMLKVQQMTLPEAIVELEKLRYFWRGGEFEFRLLRRLGSLYMDVGGYRNGFKALRQAATYFRAHEDAPQVTQQMADTFSFLYLENGADDMPPVTAIALYEEFKELTPAGSQGDEMIRKLADRLVGIDLLDRAAELLTGQVQFRLQGEEKTRVATQLALVHTLAREFDSALNVLDESEEPNTPEPLATQRRHLRVNALMGLGQRDLGLELLDDDESLDAELLRLEMHWTSSNWRNAAQDLRRIMKITGIVPGADLGDEDAVKVLNLAIAFTLSGNERALARLRRELGPSMDATDFKDAFRLVASSDSIGLIDPTSVAGKVKSVENFQTFLAEYRERLKTEVLSGVVPPQSTTLSEPAPSPGT